MSESVNFKNLNDVVAQAQALLAEKEAYDKKPTKASSKRIRSHLTNIKKLCTPAKAEMMVADSGGDDVG